MRYTGPAIVVGITAAIALSSILSAVARYPTEVILASDFGAPSLMVRDCLEQDRCYYQINPFGDSTALGVQHGAPLVDALLVAALLGDSLVLFRLGAELLGGLALILLFLWAARLWNVDRAMWLLAASLFVWGVACPIDPLKIWNPSLLPLPVFAFAAAGCAYFLRRRLSDLAVAALCAGLAAQVHVAAFVLVVALVHLLAGTHRAERALHVMTASLVFWGVLQVGSPAMFTDVVSPAIPQMFRGWAMAIPILGGVAALALLVWIARRYRSGDTGLAVYLAATHVPFFLVARWLGPSEPRYAFALVPGLAILSVLLGARVAGALRSTAAHSHARGTRVWRSSARIGFALGLGAFLLAGVHRPDMTPAAVLPPEALEFTMESARALAAHLRAGRETRFEDFFRRLRGGVRIKQILDGVAMTLPAGGREDPREAGIDLAVFPLRGHVLPATLPDGWRSVGDPTSGGILLGEYRPYLDWRVFGLHVPPAAPGQAPSWERVEYRFTSGVHPEDRSLFAARSDAGLDAFRSGLEEAELVLVRVPLRVPARSARRLLALAPSPRWYDRPASCLGAIVSVDGIESAQPLPSRYLVVEGQGSEQSGALTIAWDLSRDECLWAADRLPPPVLELERVDADLLASVFPSSALASLAALLVPRSEVPSVPQEVDPAVRDLGRRVDRLAADGLDLNAIPAHFEWIDRSAPRNKEPQTGLSVKLASIAGVWFCFVVGLGTLLWRRP